MMMMMMMVMLVTMAMMMPEMQMMMTSPWRASCPTDDAVSVAIEDSFADGGRSNENKQGRDCVVRTVRVLRPNVTSQTRNTETQNTSKQPKTLRALGGNREP